LKDKISQEKKNVEKLKQREAQDKILVNNSNYFESIFNETLMSVKREI